MPRPKGLGRESYADVCYMWALFVAVLAFGLVALFGAVAAQEPNRATKVSGECVTFERLRGVLNDRYPDVPYVYMEGDQAAVFIHEFNSAPPPSNVIATEALVVYQPGAARVVLFRNGCGFQLPPLKTDIVRRWVTKARGISV